MTVDRYASNMTTLTALAAGLEIDETRLTAGVPIIDKVWPLSPTPKRWCGYVRVSTEAQARDGDGIGVQIEQVLRWAADRGDVVCAIYGDPGVSGSIQSLPDRVGFWTMVNDAPALHRATGIIVPKLDRLSRDFIGQEMLLMDLRNKWQLEVRSTSAAENDALDGNDDPQRKLMRQILGIFAEYERATIKQRMVLGRRRKIAKGGYGGGVVGYGTKVVDGELVDDLTERRWLGIGLTMRAMGVTCDGIAQYWIESGFKTKRGRLWDRRTVLWALNAAEGKFPAQKLDALAEDYVANRRVDSRYRAGKGQHHSGAMD